MAGERAGPASSCPRIPPGTSVAGSPSWGCEEDIFTFDAVARLHEAADGAHRDLDKLATLAQREAARRKKKLVERDVVARVTTIHADA
jgi:hypothetical protein